jgi:hypothetical protein
MAMGLKTVFTYFHNNFFQLCYKFPSNCPWGKPFPESLRPTETYIRCQLIII